MEGQVVWFTGLSGAGKTTLCRAVESALSERGERVQVLDGDVVRRELWHDLGFSSEDRFEHNRRLAYLAKLICRHDVTVLVAAISPLRGMRDIPRNTIRRFVEVFVDAPLAVCEQRDPKGLYHRARAGLLREFTGIDAPYEAPTAAHLTCMTAKETVDQSCSKVLRLLEDLEWPE